MRIAVGIDHAGGSLRDAVCDAVAAAGHELLDLGEHDDYPDTALDAGRAIAAGDADRAILVCGSGAGVSVAANKLPGIRASVCHDHYTAAQCVAHDDCNVLCLGARVIGPAIAAELTAGVLRGAVQRRGAPRAAPREGLDDGTRRNGGILVSQAVNVNARAWPR